MKENFQGFTTELLQSITRYWHQFVLVLPRIAVAILVFGLVLFLASRISLLLQNRLSGKAHDPLFARFVVPVKIAIL